MTTVEDTDGDDQAVPCPFCKKDQCFGDPIAEGYGVSEWETSDCGDCGELFEWMAEYSCNVTARAPRPKGEQ